MITIRQSLHRFFIYLGVLLFSIAAFYAFDGHFETGIISFPTLWSDWFYLLYVVIPFSILIRLIYRVLVKKIPYTESLHSVVFIIGLIVIQLVYWLVVNTYKTMLFYEVEGVKARLENEVNTVKVTNIKSQYELNKFNKKRSYKISFTTHTQPTYEMHINIKEYVEGGNSKASSRSLILLSDKKVQEHYFYLVEKSYRNKLNSNDILYFKLSYLVYFPRKKYKPKVELAQKLCTWSFIECRKTEKEVAWHNTELFDSTIFQLPYKISSSETPLTKIQLSGFTNLSLLLPFTNILFLSEEITVKQGLIEKFYLKFEVNSRVDGYVYSQISSAEHTGHLLNIPLEHKSAISKGRNIIMIPVDINELSTLMNKQKESGPIGFELFISNNRSWYCPNFICEIVNKPSQLKYLVVSTKNQYRVESFPVMKSKKRIIIHQNSGQRGDL